MAKKSKAAAKKSGTATTETKAAPAAKQMVLERIDGETIEIMTKRLEPEGCQCPFFGQHDAGEDACKQCGMGASQGANRICVRVSELVALEKQKEQPPAEAPQKIAPQKTAPQRVEQTADRAVDMQPSVSRKVVVAVGTTDSVERFELGKGERILITVPEDGKASVVIEPRDEAAADIVMPSTPGMKKAASPKAPFTQEYIDFKASCAAMTLDKLMATVVKEGGQPVEFKDGTPDSTKRMVCVNKLCSIRGIARRP
jgi:hypothetical protein